MAGFMVFCAECNTAVSFRALACVKCGAPIDASNLVNREVERLKQQLEVVEPECWRVYQEMNALDVRLRKAEPSSTAKILGFSAKFLLPRYIRNSPVGEFIDDAVTNSVLSRDEHKRLNELEKKYLELGLDRTQLQTRLKQCQDWIDSQ